MLLTSIFSILIFTLFVLFFIPSSHIMFIVRLGEFCSMVSLLLLGCLGAEFVDYSSKAQLVSTYYISLGWMDLYFSFEFSKSSIFNSYLIKHFLNLYYWLFFGEDSITPESDKDLIKFKSSQYFDFQNIL